MGGRGSSAISRMPSVTSRLSWLEMVGRSLCMACASLAAPVAYLARSPVSIVEKRSLLFSGDSDGACNNCLLDLLSTSNEKMLPSFSGVYFLFANSVTTMAAKNASAARVDAACFHWTAA